MAWQIGVKKTITIAPETGSERLRRVINKGISEEHLKMPLLYPLSLAFKYAPLYYDWFAYGNRRGY